MENLINVSIQVVPLGTKDSYKIIDQAIFLIQDSKLPYKVGPFSTSIEGSYTEVMDLLSEIKDLCISSGAEEFLLNIQLHMRVNSDVRMSDKTNKFS